MDSAEIKELQELTARLGKLFADPEPGLLTWTNVVRRIIARIAQIMGGEVIQA